MPSDRGRVGWLAGTGDPESHANHSFSPAGCPTRAQLKVECKPWKIELPTRTLEVEFTTLASAHHVELNPSDVGNNDRYGAWAWAASCTGGESWHGLNGGMGPWGVGPCYCQALLATLWCWCPTKPTTDRYPSPLPWQRYVVQEIIQEMARSRPVGLGGVQGFKASEFWDCAMGVLSF